MKLLQQYLKEVENRIGITDHTAPMLRNAFRQKYSSSHLPFEEQIVIWDYIWKNASDPLIRVQSFFFCESIMKKEKLLFSSWDTIVTWQEEIDSWGLCDAMAKIYTKVLEIAPKKVYPKLRQWNKDENPWKRRQSVVSLLYFSGTKKTFLPLEDITGLIHPLLADEEYYVQKGVGWALRELHTVYHEEGYNYLSDNIKQVSAIAFAAANEKLSPDKKQLLKDKRK